MRRLLRCGFVGAAALLFVARIGAQSSAVETPEANPGRPTVSTPATLTPVGYLQFENGGFHADTSPEFTTLVGINQATKLTAAGDFVNEGERGRDRAPEVAHRRNRSRAGRRHAPTPPALAPAVGERRLAWHNWGNGGGWGGGGGWGWGRPWGNLNFGLPWNNWNNWRNGWNNWHNGWGNW